MSHLVKVIKALLFSIAIGMLFCACDAPNEKKIGIIIPLQNKALDEIVAGFTETLQTQAKEKLKFKIANAQGDLNLQRAILQQMRDEQYALIAPIGTACTEMAVAMLPTQPIVSLAANFTQDQRDRLKSCHMAIVHDEISPQQLVNFIHQVYPAMTHIALIHSASDKIYADVKIAVSAGKAVGLHIQPIMAPTLNDLYSVANAIPQNTQAIFVLKDIMIVSGIQTLVNIAEKRHIPLITTDQGSVEEGALFALGVKEREIGADGAKLATAILAGSAPCRLPIVEMNQLTVFFNQASAQKENQSLVAMQNAATTLHYALQKVNTAGAQSGV